MIKNQAGEIRWNLLKNHRHSEDRNSIERQKLNRHCVI